MRWLLLDEIVKIEKGKRAVARSHIPQTPFGVESLLIEMMAQTGGVLLGAESDFQSNVVFAKIEKAVFVGHDSVEDALAIEVMSDGISEEGGWFEGRIQGPEGEVAQARFLLVNAGPLVENEEKSITFHKGFMEHFRVREKVHETMSPDS